jgi:SAM-dependent methyltransferase
VVRNLASQHPKVLYLGDRLLYRFMDVIYLSVKPYELDPATIKELCELRLQLLKEISDEELRSAVARSLGATVARLAGIRSRILDFGTGSGRMLDLLETTQPTAELCGIDMSLDSLLLASPQRALALVGPVGPLPFRDSSFDIITALFVFHFRLPTAIRRDLRRILRGEGLLVGNVYGGAISAYERDMEDTGWELCSSVPVHGIAGHRIDVWRAGSPPAVMS